MSDFSDTSITELAAIIATHLSDRGIDVVLVGGLAVEIYTDNLYLTHDIDMVATNEKRASDLHSVMSDIGFYKKGRVFENTSTKITVEFPTAPLSVGNEMITTTTSVEVDGKRIPILTVSDVVKDRLAAYIHWSDNQSLVQATAIILKHQLDSSGFKGFCLREGNETHFQQLIELHHVALHEESVSMQSLEKVLTKLLIRNLN